MRSYTVLFTCLFLQHSRSRSSRFLRVNGPAGGWDERSWLRLSYVLRVSSQADALTLMMSVMQDAGSIVFDFQWLDNRLEVIVLPAACPASCVATRGQEHSHLL